MAKKATPQIIDNTIVPTDFQNQNQITIKGARQHVLKNIDINIPKNKLIVITGPSGSGKSSLAFDTIYAEGQRRYVESLSSYARQFISQNSKPDVDSIYGLSPSISIDQKTTSHNPRSTVATTTEIYDYLRVMYARIGTVYSPATNEPIVSHSASEITEIISNLPIGTKLRVCAPIIRGKKGEHVQELMDLKKQGYQRIKIDGELCDLDNIPKLDKSKPHIVEVVVDRIIIAETMGNRLSDSIEKALKAADGILCVDIVGLPEGIKKYKLNNGKEVKTGDTLKFSEKFMCLESDFSLDELEPRIFSFNSPHGACKSCNGLGTEIAFNIDAIIPDDKLSLDGGAVKLWYDNNKKYYSQVLNSLAKQYNFDMKTPFKDLSKEHQDIVLYGSKGEIVTFNFETDFEKSKVTKVFGGVVEDIARIMNALDDDQTDMDRFQVIANCRVCSGHRLKYESLLVRVHGLNIGELCNLSITDCIEWFKNLSPNLSITNQEIAKPIIKEVISRMIFLNDVGLNYLTLSRGSATLSGGESQRIRLASQIGSGLCGVIYVLDEPSIGLHPSDNDKLIGTLRRLRDLGNTVIVVEHEEETMLAADHIIDIGPGAGVDGGYVVAQGTLQEIMDNEASITGQFLSGKEYIEIPRARRKYGKNQSIEIVNAREHNLKGINVKIPLGLFVAVCGVSGGGKSTLVIDTLYAALAKKMNGAMTIPGLHDKILNIENIDKIIKIDQSPIGRTPRSNPATYTAVFGQIRDWFTALPESKARGYKPGRFSFNVKGGRCENCQGDGVLKVEMHFLPDVYINCEVCRGARYNKETLEIKYKDKSIADVLNMTVKESCEFFKIIPAIYEKVLALKNVGLGYIRLGQPATTLSGGEAQRVKLAKELSKKSTGNTLYILDEPTTGLHSSDIKKLLHVLHTLVDYGNSMLVIEHNIDVIKTADYVIDVGPTGGMKGGFVVAEGTPEEVAANPNSVTGSYLKKALDRGVRAG